MHALQTLGLQVPQSLFYFCTLGLKLGVMHVFGALGQRSSNFDIAVSVVLLMTCTRTLPYL